MEQPNNKHNKRRNSALVYEFLIRQISQSLVDNDQARGSKSLRILKKWFRPGTQIYKEFRLANSLLKTNSLSQGVAINILSEAKSAALSFDISALEREKSLLIRDINHILGQNVWESKVSNYKKLATIQTLFNNWREKDVSNLKTIAEYQNSLVEWLCAENSYKESDPVGEKLSSGEFKQLFKIMEKKINEKWGNSLTSLQKEIVREWLILGDDKEKIVEFFFSLKSIMEESSREYLLQSEDKNIKEKLENVLGSIQAEKLEKDSITEETVSRFMAYAKLVDEIKS